MGTPMPDPTASPPKQALCFSETTGQQSKQAVLILQRGNRGTSSAPAPATPPPGAPGEHLPIIEYQKIRSPLFP